MDKRWSLATGFILFILLCVSLAYWGLQLFQPPARAVAAPPRAAAPEIQPQAAATLFGGRGGATAAASNYRLHGIIQAGPRDSVAILSVDGKPAQAIRSGTEVAPGVTVQEVHRDHVLLAEGGAMKRVDLPETAGPQPGMRAPVPARPTPPQQQIQPAPSAQPAQVPEAPPGLSQGDGALVPDEGTAGAKARVQRGLMSPGGNGAGNGRGEGGDGEVVLPGEAPPSTVLTPGG